MGTSFGKILRAGNGYVAEELTEVAAKPAPVVEKPMLLVQAEAAERLVQTYQEAREELLVFADLHAPVLDRLLELISQHNTRLSEAKAGIKAYEGDAKKLKLGPFMAKAPATSYSIDASLLTDAAKLLPGAMVPDTAALRKYAANPLLDPELREVIQSAIQEKKGQPAVQGPKELSLDLGR